MGPLFCSSNRGLGSCRVLEGVKWQAKKPRHRPIHPPSSYSSQTERAGPSQGLLTQSEGLPLPLEFIILANKASIVFTHLFQQKTLCRSDHGGSFPANWWIQIIFTLHVVLSLFSPRVQGHIYIRVWLAQKCDYCGVFFWLFFFCMCSWTHTHIRVWLAQKCD